MIKLKLGEMLDERKMTAYALHIKSGLHQSVISKIKRNLSKALQLDVLDTLCKALECQPGELIAYENETATQGVNTQIVNTTQNVERATQNVNTHFEKLRQNSPPVAANAAEVFEQLKLKGKDSGKVFNNSILEIVNSSSDNEFNLTTAAAGELLGLKPRTVRENAEKGLLHGKQGKQNHWFFRRSDVDEYKARRG
jgi:putative transcriptional regulator